MRRRRTRHAAPGRKRRIGAVTFVILVMTAAVALAWTTSTSNPGNSITAATIGAAGTPTFTRTPSTGVSCTNVDVTWTAATNADRYKVERRISGVWTTLATSHATTMYPDAPGAAGTHRTITYRITPFFSGSSSWTAPSAQAQITCGQDDVEDLAITSTTCGKPVLTWSAATGATRYDIYRSINGAAYATFAGSTDIAATTFTDSGLPASGALPGQIVGYRVRSDDGTVNSTTDSNTASIASYAPFRITGIAITGDADGSIEQNETLAVTFSEAADPATGGTGAQSIYPQRNGASKGFYFAAGTASAAASSIASFTITNNPTGGNVAVAGTSVWTSGTLWTWTRGVGATAASAPTFGTQAVGTSASRVRCVDGTTNLVASTVTPAGWF